MNFSLNFGQLTPCNNALTPVGLTAYPRYSILKPKGYSIPIYTKNTKELLCLLRPTGCCHAVTSHDVMPWRQMMSHEIILSFHKPMFHILACKSDNVGNRVFWPGDLDPWPSNSSDISLRSSPVRSRTFSINSTTDAGGNKLAGILRAECTVMCKLPLPTNWYI